MTTKSRTPDKPRSTFWRSRTRFRVGKTRRERRTQYYQQIIVLAVLLGITIIAGLVFIIANWQGAGSAASVQCSSYPEFCVPLVDGAGDPAYAAFEAPTSRTLDLPSQAVEGVVRGMTEDNVPFIGNPDAPIHFRTVSNFACSHCNTYHTTDLDRFIRDYVLQGQATLGFVVVTNTAGSASAAGNAAQAAFCAGEQGAFWEMGVELFRLARTFGTENGFALPQIRFSANAMGLDADALVSCIASQRYAPLLYEHQTFAQDNGVSGTPTLLVRFGDDTEWTRWEYTERDYAHMASMTERANAQ